MDEMTVRERLWDQLTTVEQILEWEKNPTEELKGFVKGHTAGIMTAIQMMKELG